MGLEIPFSINTDYKSALTDLEMPIRHWRDGMTLRLKIVLQANECLVMNHSTNIVSRI